MYCSTNNQGRKLVGGEGAGQDEEINESKFLPTQRSMYSGSGVGRVGSLLCFLVETCSHHDKVEVTALGLSRATSPKPIVFSVELATTERA